MNRIADKISRFTSHFQFHMTDASLMIEVGGDGCYEKVRFAGLKTLRYDIDKVQGELEAFDCAVIVHDCGEEIGEEDGLYVSLPRGKRRGGRVFNVELFVNANDFGKFRHMADIMIRDDRYDLEFYLPFTGIDDIGGFPSEEIVYDMAGMRFELVRPKQGTSRAAQATPPTPPVKPARARPRSR